MALDYAKINKYLKEVRQVEESLENHQELFDIEKLIEFKQITLSLEQNVELTKKESRKLSIGIVGDVKAGKSSFLNACIFDGEEYLPKAATPMTAALTKITYSETPKAIIHFYTREDWGTIEKQSAEYDEDLQKEYELYCKNVTNAKTIRNLSNRVPLMSIEEFERSKYNCKSENIRAAKELTKMAKDPFLMDKLDNSDEMQGEIISKLNDYVGVNGRYTPIVSCVELQVNNPAVKDLEIVDTPGLNDPIASRSVRTKQFLRSCDVVLILSRCSQFMTASTVALMANTLPAAGVREILVIGSKLDSGILNENTIVNFDLAYKKSLESYKTQFINNLSEAQKMTKHTDILDKMSLNKVLFASPMCFSIDRKIKNGSALDELEKKTYENLHTKFNNFKDSYLPALGGMNQVKKALNEVLKRKIDIIEGKNSDLSDNAKLNHTRVLDKILQETVSSRTKLETSSAEELKKKTSKIQNVIDSSRTKLLHIFDRAVIRCDEKVEQIKPQLTIEMGQHKRISTQKSTHDDYRVERVGFLGLKKEVIHYDVTVTTADTALVIDNIKSYSAKCHSFVNSEFRNIFNKEEFAQKIKEVILNAFNRSEKEFDEDEILLPLQNVLAKISIPHIEFDFTPYIDEVDARFKEGCAKNEDIHRLTQLQSKLLNGIEIEIVNQLMDALQKIKKTLDTQAVNFADQIEKNLCCELEKLKGQIEEKERYIEEYNKFTDTVREVKSKLPLI